MKMAVMKRIEAADAADYATGLAPEHRMVAKHIIGMTSMLVEQAGNAQWQQIQSTLCARRVLLEHLRNDVVDPDELSCVDALFAAVEESEHTLGAVFGQSLPG
jgi:hypothetical protein